VIERSVTACFSSVDAFVVVVPLLYVFPFLPSE